MAILPVNSYLDQRSDITNKERQLADLVSTNDDLQLQADLLQTYETVEEIARRDHGMVKPGEEVFVVLPAAPDPVMIPDTWPFSELTDQLTS